MGHGQSGLGDEPLKMIGDGMNVLDPGVDKENLSASLKLPFNGGSDEIIIVADDKCPNRKTILRRRLNQAEIA
jgi:hypothetical protein